MIEFPTLAADRAGGRTMRLAVTQTRRAGYPDRTTWGPDDAAPGDDHWVWQDFVVDGEGGL
ncbi:hypothetical protein [Streptomyces sp. NPDC059788]|uniref:hypothetical protein n=1 Tax=Streptomyces sp. NPDC059788 TaxID=3346948 RepID=UPI0036616584